MSTQTESNAVFERIRDEVSGTPVVLYPSELVQDGGRVAPRRAAVR